MKYGLFLGCNAPAIRPDLERAMRLTMPELGVELVEMEGYACCPGYGTFPASDEIASLAVSGRNLAIAEERGVDVLVECGSCYSVLRHAAHNLRHDEEKAKKTNELLAIDNKKFSGTSQVRHMIDVLYHEVGTEKIAQSIKHRLDGIEIVVQYPCHTLFPSDVMGFDDPRNPHKLGELVEAMGAKVPRFSREYQCCGGAGGFAARSKKEATAFAKKKFDAIKAETNAEAIVVSCITCLMFMNNIQTDFGEGWETIPVLDYNQLLALCMGFDPKQVCSIGETLKVPAEPREKFIEKITKAAVPG
ncbi:MAG: CoB--CoM heterodisulfide reductase iron-sulfur subunit B family protein [Chloroflexi bacterium]|nr:CoB--CoM heterodisulfide reductase iron-sulfur subunit B family protein [Chloroflexota bacterium]